MVVASWNIDGQTRHTNKLDIQQFIKDHNIDILLIQETHLLPDINFSLQGMTIYRNDRPNSQRPRCKTKGWGGTAIAIKHGIPHRPTPTPALSQMEATIVTVNTSAGECILISTYFKPTATTLEDDLDNLTNLGPQTVLAGDFNAKHKDWNCNVTNTAGRKLKEYLQTHPELKLFPPDTPTRYPKEPNRRPDILDIAIADSNLTMTKPKPEPHGLSDHYPIVFTVEMTKILLTPYSPQPPTNWELYKDILTNNATQLTSDITTNNINDTINDINKLLNKTKATSTDYITKTTEIGAKNLPPDIRETIRQKRKMRRLWQQHRNPALRQELKRLENLVKSQLTDYYAKKWNNTIHDINADRSYNALYKLQRALRQAPNTATAIKNPTNPTTYIYDNAPKAEAFADMLEARFSDNRPRPPLPDITDAEPLTPATAQELKTIITQLHNNKAPGPDKITNDMLKNLPDNIIEILLTLFNSCLRLAYFPTAWKTAKIKMLPKPGKPNELIDSYRPISLLPIPGKILERLILQRLLTTVDENKLLRDEQFAFRPNHSAPLQALNLSEKIHRDLNYYDRVPAVFLDIVQAFDRVPHDILMQKLSSQLPPAQCKIIHSFISERCFFVQVESARSSPRTITRSVPQGAVLSPLLFSLFINDLLNPPPPQTKLFLYADDVAIVTEGLTFPDRIKTAETALDQAHQWANDNGMQFSFAKTAAICFQRPRRYRPPPHQKQRIRMNNNLLDWKDETKYLGLTFDRSLKWKTHINKICTNVRLRTKTLRPLFFSPALQTSFKVHLYKQCIRPLMTYAPSVWIHVPFKTYLETLTVTENHVLRQITRAPRLTNFNRLRQDLHLTHIIQLSIELATNELHRAFTDSNRPNVFRLYDKDPTFPRHTARLQLPSDLIIKRKKRR